MPTMIGLTWDLQGINIVANEGNASYHGLQATFRATAWRDLTFSAAYTWSHAVDIIDGQLFNNLDNPRDPSYQLRNGRLRPPEHRGRQLRLQPADLPEFERVYQDSDREDGQSLASR